MTPLGGKARRACCFTQLKARGNATQKKPGRCFAKNRAMVTGGAPLAREGRYLRDMLSPESLPRPGVCLKKNHIVGLLRNRDQYLAKRTQNQFF